MNLDRFKLRPDEPKPAWGGMFWWVSMGYVFIGPYQRHAGWVEWTLTSLAFLGITILYVIGLIYWSRKQVLQRVCVATALLAIVFAGYRFEGIAIIVLVAAFGPFSVGGNIGRSAIIVVLTALLPLAATWLSGINAGFFPYVLAAEALLIGAGTTFAARQTAKDARHHKAIERERIARDLHDVLGHTLSVIILKSELAGRLVDQNTERARAEIGDIERTARKALAEVREAILGYHGGDLPAEFERAKATLKTANIEVECRYAPAEIPLAQERVLTMVLREAVTNVVRHARAKHCYMTLEKIGDSFRLNLRDDGRGGAHTEGLGMRGIRERVATAGGNVSWNTESGTELTITLPVVVGTSNAR
jgi:two-component system, NarL family, sensor histidine kinase DesK